MLNDLNRIGEKCKGALDMLNNQMTKKAYGENNSTQARHIELLAQKRAYDQMEKEPSEHAKKFFKMEGHHLKCREKS